MLHMYTPGPMSSCSKAPRGLLVLLRTDGIFTVNALSPSSSLRQCPNHYAIRAGQNFNRSKLFACCYGTTDFVPSASLQRSDYIFTPTKSGAWRIVSEDFASHLLLYISACDY